MRASADLLKIAQPFSLVCTEGRDSGPLTMLTGMFGWPVAPSALKTCTIRVPEVGENCATGSA